MIFLLMSVFKRRPRGGNNREGTINSFRDSPSLFVHLKSYRCRNGSSGNISSDLPNLIIPNKYFARENT